VVLTAEHYGQDQFKAFGIRRRGEIIRTTLKEIQKFDVDRMGQKMGPSEQSTELLVCTK